MSDGYTKRERKLLGLSPERKAAGSYLAEDEEEFEEVSEFCNDTCRVMFESEDEEYYDVYDPCESCPLAKQPEEEEEV